MLHYQLYFIDPPVYWRPGNHRFYSGINFRRIRGGITVGLLRRLYESSLQEKPLRRDSGQIFRHTEWNSICEHTFRSYFDHLLYVISLGPDLLYHPGYYGGFLIYLLPLFDSINRNFNKHWDSSSLVLGTQKILQLLQ